MADTWFYMSRNDEALENPKKPYFRMSLPPPEGSKEWTPILVCWKSKNGKGYSCKFEDNVEIRIKPKTQDEQDPLMD